MNIEFLKIEYHIKEKRIDLSKVEYHSTKIIIVWLILTSQKMNVSKNEHT